MPYKSIEQKRQYDRLYRREERALHTRRASFLPRPEQIHSYTIHDGVVIVGSDLHAWPKETSTAYRALLHFIKLFRLDLFVLNGDVFDGARISHFGANNFQNRAHIPTVLEELEGVKAQVGGIDEALPKGVERVWTFGNHDARFQKYIENNAPEIAGVEGTHLKDHFSAHWLTAWGVFINQDFPSFTEIRHSFKGGQVATRENVIRSGINLVTGHLHQQNVWRERTRTGDHYGVDAGMLARCNGPQFDYLETRPSNWCSGFAVLTYSNGDLLPPELVTVWDEAAGIVVFRGERIHV